MMEMHSLSHSKVQVPQTGVTANEDPSNDEAKIDICDTVAFTPRDLSPRGTLTLIIQIKDGGECSPFIEEYKKCGLGQFKEELDVINGFTFEIEPSNLKKFFSLLPENVEITVDRPISFFPGMPGKKR